MRYICTICGYVYDEEVEGVAFDELADDYRCPLCTAPKELFEKEIKEEKEEVREAIIDEDIHEISNGELAAIFSNLARGLEKQSKLKESKDMMTLSEHFRDKMTPFDDTSLETLRSLIDEDITVLYPNVQKVADEKADGGTKRIVTWGLKVTSIIKALLDSYTKEGEEFLMDKKIFICSVCGFIYVGKKAPDICPVCKVPEFKFEEVR